MDPVLFGKIRIGTNYPNSKTIVSQERALGSGSTCEERSVRTTTNRFDLASNLISDRPQSSLLVSSSAIERHWRCTQEITRQMKISNVPRHSNKTPLRTESAYKQT